MARVLRRLHNEAEGRDEEVDEFGGVRVVDVLPELCLRGHKEYIYNAKKHSSSPNLKSRDRSAIPRTQRELLQYSQSQLRVL